MLCLYLIKIGKDKAGGTNNAPGTLQARVIAWLEDDQPTIEDLWMIVNSARSMTEIQMNARRYYA